VKRRENACVCVWGGGGTLHFIGNKIFPSLKVPRQCSLVLLMVQVRLREGKALGSAKT
jgi:hypothetical protein